MSQSAQELSPFLKWAGGKRWFMNAHRTILPTTYNRYIEPFLGSGAVFFNLQPKTATLSDINFELIETYSAVKADWRKVVALLKRHNGYHSKSYYYEVRKSRPRTIFGTAARLIYLNRTCWNGLYRVNRKGEFNVPIGTRTNVLLDTDFERISSLLQNTTLKHSDFEPVIDDAVKNDLIFVDPPYTVKHNSNGFIKYNENLFSWDDQIRLFKSLVRAKKRGAKVVVTNAHHASVIKLYKGDFDLVSAERKSLIAGSNADRGSYKELIIHHI